MNQLLNTQQNQITIQNPENGKVYLLKNKQYIDQNQDRFEGIIESNKGKILCDCFKKYSDQFMRCLDELIQSPQDNIINYLDFYIDPKTNVLFVIYEYVEKECFLSYQLQYTQLDDQKKLEICLDIAKGIYYLHLLSYRHRNINPGNICFVNGQYKITNLNQVVHFIMKEKLDIVGDQSYWTQELLSNQEYDHTIDIFAFACVAFEIFTSQKLFSPQDKRLEIPQEKVKYFEKLPNIINQFINLVIVQGKRDLRLFLEDHIRELEDKKKHASKIQIRSKTQNDDKDQSKTPTQTQSGQFVHSEKKPPSIILNNITQQFIPPNKFPFQQKLPDTQNQQITFQQQQQFQSLQKPQSINQVPFQPFQQQGQQRQTQKPFLNVINPDTKPKFPNFTNQNNDMFQQHSNQQPQFNANVSPIIFEQPQIANQYNNQQSQFIANVPPNIFEQPQIAHQYNNQQPQFIATVSPNVFEQPLITNQYNNQQPQFIANVPPIIFEQPQIANQYNHQQPQFIATVSPNVFEQPLITNQYNNQQPQFIANVPPIIFEQPQIANQYNNQQSQFIANAPPNIFETPLNSHRKNNSSQQNQNLQEFNQNQKQDIDEDIFKCQIDTQKEEREKENQRYQKIFNQVQKVVKEEEQKYITQYCMELNKQNVNLTIEEILEELIKKKVKDQLGLTID